MASSIEAILAFVTAVSMLIIFLSTGSLSSELKVFETFFIWLGVASLIISPISTFFITLAASYFSALLYNKLASKLGGIKLGLEGRNVTHIPVFSLALILAIIETIWAFIIGLTLALSLAMLNAVPYSPISAMIIGIINSALPDMIGTGPVLLMVGLPLTVFVIGFLDSAIIAFLYNRVGAKVAYLQLNFVRITGSTYQLKSIPVVPIAIIAAVISTIMGFTLLIISLAGFIDLVTLGSSGKTIVAILSRIDLVVYLIPYFIIAALIAIFYNFLAPKIGGIMIKME